MTTTIPKVGKKSREAAQAEVSELLRYLRDYTRVNRRAAAALRDELHWAYCEANYGVDGPHVPSLDEADILLTIADWLGRDWGFEDVSRAQLEDMAGEMKSRR